MGDDVPIYISDGDSERVKEKPFSLSDEQHQALDAAKEGRNIFITGSAGVGKSFLLKEIMKIIPKRTSHVTASTGVAACNIGGTTLHSFAGIGLGEKSAFLLASSINSKFKVEVKRRWLGCRVLVIDEISMIDGYLFEKVETVARLVRNIPKPFGGIQVILCGDFLQLPPVKTKYFAFETKAWSEVVEETIVLKKVFRQNEVGLITLLNRIRTGQFTKLDVEVLQTCRNTKFIDDGIKATRLFPHRHSCDTINTKELAKLKGPSVIYTSIDQASKPMYSEMLEKNSKFASRLELRCGAQVMLLINKNVKGHLVNGARGVVIGFRDRSKSLEENLESIMKQRKEDNHVGAVGDKDLLENTIVISEDEEEEEDEYFTEKRSPIVLFAAGVVDVINIERLSIVVGGKNVATRTQIPLSLAWAVSIHKSQGMTLDRIDVNIAESFEHGQSYVALSRVTSLDGLLLRDFNAKKITAHPKVLDYYKNIDSTFDKFPIEGEEDLKAFIEEKKKLEGYEKALKEIKARNEAAPSCSYIKDNIYRSLNTNQATNLKNLPSDFAPLVSKAQGEMNSKLLNSTDKDGCTGIIVRDSCTNVKTENITMEERGVLAENIKVEEERGVLAENIKMEEGTGVLAENIKVEEEIGVVAENIKVEEGTGVLAENIKMEEGTGVLAENIKVEEEIGVVAENIKVVEGTGVLAENIKVEENIGILAENIKMEESTPTTPLPSCKALLKADSCLADCRKALEEAKAGPSNFFANERLSFLDNSKKSCDKSRSRSIVIDSDSDDAESTGDNRPSHNESDMNEIDVTIFDRDDFDDSLLDESTSSSANNFLDNICPDLLQSADSLTSDNVLHHISKRKRTEEENNIKLSKRIVHYAGDNIKLLLQAKACEIENKKKAALERRRRSLQRLHK